MPATIYKKDIEDLEGRAPFGSGECVAMPQALTDIVIPATGIQARA